MGESSSPSSSSPSLLPPEEKGASRSAQDARQYDRLRWRCRRGLLELDFVLKNFLDQGYASLTPAEQDTFDKLLAVPDNILWAYVQGNENPPDNELMQLVSKIRK
jgi:antitoxin CptB